jgi:GT2 family glycosyltransferase
VTLTVSAIIVNWNHGHLLPACLDALLAQDGVPLEVTVVDNGSHDGSPDRIARHYPTVRLQAFAENLGFARALNWGVAHTNGDWILSLNPDAVAGQGFLREMVGAVDRCQEESQRIGIVAPKLLQPASPPVMPRPRNGQEGQRQPVQKSREESTAHLIKTSSLRRREDRPGSNPTAGQPAIDWRPSSILDSTGLFIDRRRRPYDRGQGEPDRGQYDDQPYVFGACGAAALYRRAMLEDVALDGEYFGEDFFAYYEDADLAWRAQLRGWRALHAPLAVASHARGWGDTLRRPGRDPKSAVGPRLALRNRYLMATRNDTLSHFVADMPCILGAELPRLAYAAVTRPQVLLGLLDLARALPLVLRQRRQIQRRRSVDAGTIRRWFVVPSGTDGASLQDWTSLTLSG